jgi:NRPS condensation-like uncharacterized protein
MSGDRKLGQLEQMTEFMNVCANTWNIVTISRIRGNIQPAILQKALDIVQYRHPRLKSRIVRRKDGLYFQTQGTQEVSLQVLDSSVSESWEEVVQNQMNQKFESDRCLWRVVLLADHNDPQSNYLITTLHHAIADALSSVQLHGEICQRYHQIFSGETIEPITELRSLPPVEQLIPKSAKGWRGQLNSIILLLRIVWQKIWYRPQALKNQKYAPISGRSSAMISRQINPEVTQKFIQRCHQEKITVNSALSAIIAHTIAKEITKGKSNKLNIVYLVFMDTRRHLHQKISHENLNFLATTNMGFSQINIHESIWKIANDFKKHLDTSIKRGDMFNIIKLAQLLIDFCFIFPRDISVTFSISNIGQVDIPQNYGELELEEISFAASSALYAGALATNVATFAGKMRLNFVISQPATSWEIAEKLVNNIISHIHYLTSSTMQLRGNINE